MRNLTAEQIKRQYDVDNAICQLVHELNPAGKNLNIKEKL